MKNLTIHLALLLIITSCTTQNICDEDNQSILVARFKTTENGGITDTIMAGITIYGIREGKTDSLLYDSLSVGRVELPLDPNSDISRFVITNEVRKDTLVFTHSSEAYLISSTCGFAARFTLEGFTAPGGWIVDMELREGEIDAELETNEEHLWIYF